MEGRAVVLSGSITRFPHHQTRWSLSSLTVTASALTFETYLRRVRRFARDEVTTLEIAEWPVWIGGYTIIQVVLTEDRRPSWTFKPATPDMAWATLNDFLWPVERRGGWDGSRPMWDN